MSHRMVEIYLCCRWTSFETWLRSSSTSLRSSAVAFSFPTWRPTRTTTSSVGSGSSYVIGKAVNTEEKTGASKPAAPTA